MGARPSREKGKMGASSDLGGRLVWQGVLRGVVLDAERLRRVAREGVLLRLGVARVVATVASSVSSVEAVAVVIPSLRH
jgi:hypothetical protein